MKKTYLPSILILLNLLCYILPAAAQKKSTKEKTVVLVVPEVSEIQGEAFDFIGEYKFAGPTAHVVDPLYDHLGKTHVTRSPLFNVGPCMNLTETESSFIMKNTTTRMGMKVIKFDSQDYSFTVDMYFESSLNEKFVLPASKLVQQRYVFTIKSCDGAPLQKVAAPDSFSELLKGFEDLEFENFMSCEIEPKLISSNFVLNHEAFSTFEQKSDRIVDWQYFKDRKPGALLAATDSSMGSNVKLIPNQGLILKFNVYIPIPLRGREGAVSDFSQMTLAENRKGSEEQLEKSKEIVSAIIDLFEEYTEELGQFELSKELTKVEQGEIYRGLLDRFKPQVAEKMQEFQKGMLPLQMLQKLSLLKTLNEAYDYVQTGERRIKNLHDSPRTLNLDKVIISHEAVQADK